MSLATPQQPLARAQIPGTGTTVVLALVLGLLAGGLRFFRLGDWSFAHDEIATIQETDSLFTSEVDPALPIQIVQLPKLIPLSHTLHWIGYQTFGRDELGSRIIPALLGTLQVVLIFLLLESLLGRPTAVITALLVALWPKHLYVSQENRFYAIACFSVALTLLVGAWAVERRSSRWMIVACLLALLTMFTHTLQAVVLGVLFLGAVAANWTARRSIPWMQLLIVATAGLVALAILWFYCLPHGRGWNEHSVGLSTKRAVLASVVQIGWPLAAMAGLGVILLLGNRSAQSGFWIVAALAWIASTVLMPQYFFYHDEYVMPLSLAIFVLAGWAIADVYRRLDESRPSAAVAWVIVAFGFNLPGVASHYVNGSRQDYRAGARYVGAQWQIGDHVAVVGEETFTHYADDRVRSFITPLDVRGSLDRLAVLAETHKRLWIIVPSGRSGKDKDFEKWLRERARLKLRERRQRFDYFEHVIEVYLVERESYPPQFRADVGARSSSDKE